MEQRAQRKRWLGLMLIIFLFLTGVCGADAAEDIPAYTSFSCAFVSDQAEQAAECKDLVQTAVSMEHVISIPVEQLYRNSLIRLPDMTSPMERICQSRGELLEQGKPERHSSGRYAERVNDRAQEPFRGLAAVCYSRDIAETAASFCRNRIITYIHDQDGHKGDIL